MSNKHRVWAGAGLILLGWLSVAWGIVNDDASQSSNVVQVAMAVSVAILTYGTGRVALLASEVAKLEHEQTEPADDHDVTTGGRHVR